MTDSAEFQRRLMATFKAEASEHISSMGSLLVQIEQAPEADRGALVETVFRQAHSLKGASRAVGQDSIELVCQALEDVLARMKRRDITFSTALFDLLHQARQTLEKLLAGIDSHEPRPQGMSDLILRLRTAAAAEAVEMPAPPKAAVEARAPVAGARPELPRNGPETPTVRIASAKLDAVLFDAEEMISVRIAGQERVRELSELNAQFAEWRRRWETVEPELRKIRSWLSAAELSRENALPVERLLQFLEQNASFWAEIHRKLTHGVGALRQDQHLFGGMLDSFINDVKSILLLPFSSLVQTFPPLVRELAREQGKEAELSIHGEEVEVDRRVLDELKDALIHLLRNSVDHGIEPPAERTAAGKPARGRIHIAIRRVHGNQVEISLSDDGRGMDTSELKSAAIQEGIINEEEAAKLSGHDMLRLAFESGISTSSRVSDISGRGLGLAIVQQKVRKLAGSVVVESEPGKGTTFTLHVPVTMATFRGLVVASSKQQFVLPVASIDRVARVRPEQIRPVEGRDTITVEGRVVPVTTLAATLRMEPAAADPASFASVVILNHLQTRVGFFVDEILGEQEVLTKPLGPQLLRVRNVAAAAVLGSGEVVPVLHVPDLVRAAGAVAARRGLPQPALGEKPSILIVEDSHTSRILLKNVLEEAGYMTETAVDGVDGLTKLKGGRFNLVISDVDMPRMNGFDLTARIRKDPRTADLPVVLVTSLDSREDRERGMDVGADAYVVKSRFDQANLLEVIRRLV